MCLLCYRDFEDAAKAKEMAVALIEKGVDILAVDADQQVSAASKTAAKDISNGANGDQNALAQILLLLVALMT